MSLGNDTRWVGVNYSKIFHIEHELVSNFSKTFDSSQHSHSISKRKAEERLFSLILTSWEEDIWICSEPHRARGNRGWGIILGWFLWLFPSPERRPLFWLQWFHWTAWLYTPRITFNFLFWIGDRWPGFARFVNTTRLVWLHVLCLTYLRIGPLIPTWRVLLTARTSRVIYFDFLAK